MRLFQHRHRLLLASALALLAPHLGRAEDIAQLEPYKIVRSLQYVQDSVVAGDHSAADMQRFLLSTIDQRLRSVDQSVFDDDRNVDAALIYAMSGGNPATLDYLMARDLHGRFDQRVTDVLKKYLEGRGLLVVKTLTETAQEYKNKKVGPYLLLIAANVTIANSPEDALKLYDQARLDVPGTILEEAALRRSLAICVDASLIEKGLSYAQRYARRFLHSPYAGQFADLFVKLAVDHNDTVKPEDIATILDFMDGPRKREVYLRIARAAAIAGKRDLAALAASRAQALSGEGGEAFGALADFYGGMARIPTENIGKAAEAIDAVPQDSLSPGDRMLRAAARSIAEQVLRAPDPASLTQASDPNLANEEIISGESAGQQSVTGPSEEKGAPVPAAVKPSEGPPATALPDADPAFHDFVVSGRSKLDAIDGLLNKESK